jgi:hypothetical protein
VGFIEIYQRQQPEKETYKVKPHWLVVCSKCQKFISSQPVTSKSFAYAISDANMHYLVWHLPKIIDNLVKKNAVAPYRDKITLKFLVDKNYIESATDNLWKDELVLSMMKRER